MKKAPEAFRTISEVSELLDTPAHVLRFWESKFYQIRPVKRAGGRRYYRPDDVALLAGIRELLQVQGLTIRGVQKVLLDNGVRHVASLAPDMAELVGAAETLARSRDESDSIEDAELVEETVAQPDVPRDADTDGDDRVDDTPSVDDDEELLTDPVAEAEAAPPVAAAFPDEAEGDAADLPSAPPVRADTAPHEVTPANTIGADESPGDTNDDPAVPQGETVDDLASISSGTRVAPEPAAATPIERQAAPMPATPTAAPAAQETDAARAGSDATVTKAPGSSRPGPGPTPAAKVAETAAEASKDTSAEVHGGPAEESAERQRLAHVMRSLPRDALGPRRDRAELLARRIDALLDRMSEASGAGRW